MTQNPAQVVPAPSATSWAELDLSAIRHNVTLLARTAAPATVAAVVKADGYGHGAVAVAQAALDAGASRLCVFTVREAAHLRRAAVVAPILSLGPLHGDDLNVAADLDISVVIDTPATARQAADAARSSDRRIGVHINLDSGMQRYGRPHQEALELAGAIREHRELELEAVLTHFPDAPNPDPTATLRAFEQFRQTADLIGAPLRHAAASAAAFHLPQTGLDFVRAGIALYGIDPAPAVAASAAGDLRPALSWRASLLAVRDLQPGDSVSYGGLWTAERQSRIGVIGAGYADGLRRALSPGGDVLVRGRRAPFRGAICMDSAMIDLTEIPTASVGDTVTIIGDDGDETILAWDIARRLDTIPYEVFTSITSRVPRIVIDESA